MSRDTAPKRSPRPGRLRLLALLAPLLLAACAAPSGPAGFAPVAEQVQARSGLRPVWPRTPADEAAAEARSAELLAQPLGLDQALALSLLKHRGLQARFEELGLAQAELLQATRLPNPSLSIGRFRQGEATEIELRLGFDLLRLALAPWLRPLAEAEFAARQQTLAAELLAHLAGVRQAWIEAVAAQERLHYRRQIREAAEAGAELARRMAEVGNFNALRRAREQAFYAEATLRLAQAEQAAQARREALIRAIGLWGSDTAFRLPERLPPLPAQPAERPDIEQQAMASRLDLQAARQAVSLAAARLGLTRPTRWVNVLDVGFEREQPDEGPNRRGTELRFELPLFDSGQARLAQAEARHRIALQQAAQLAIEARSEVREAYGAYRHAHDIAVLHQAELLPLAQRIVDEQLLRYNGMLVGVFELLADARAQVAAVEAAMEARRTYWQAEAALAQALIGRPVALPVLTESPSAVPAAAAGGH